MLKTIVYWYNFVIVGIIFLLKLIFVYQSEIKVRDRNKRFGLRKEKLKLLIKRQGLVHVVLQEIKLSYIIVLIQEVNAFIIRDHITDRKLIVKLLKRFIWLPEIQKRDLTFVFKLTDHYYIVFRKEFEMGDVCGKPQLAYCLNKSTVTL